LPFARRLFPLFLKAATAALPALCDDTQGFVDGDGLELIGACDGEGLFVGAVGVGVL